ncbi:MAG TPA: 23S rRNA (adenine(2030)-N(6))-methyltransferase RlmJ [Xanthobacteraceae bacterium]|nr:23S rRNA (adenine(2030)-N(6))-methyltransferase RlmJ [Xanthobacteraceae bacterium]
MNYRHAFHVGNFADVFKHSVLVRVLLHLRNKDAPFRVIDTHAGIGRYDLAGDEASRTAEWRGGIARLCANPPRGAAGELIEPYLALVRGENAGGALKHYPGSPAIALSLCRAQDRMIFCELHPQDFSALRRAVGGDRRAKTMEADGWSALKAYLPPKERRGIVLVDPAFEAPDEFGCLANGLAEAHKRWATGTYLLWYPLKDREATRAFERRIAGLHIPKILRAEIDIGAQPKAESLHACALVIVNPTWPLEDELKTMLPALVHAFANQGGGKFHLDWMAR